MGDLSSSRLRVRDPAIPLLERFLGEGRKIVYLAIPSLREVLYVGAGAMYRRTQDYPQRRVGHLPDAPLRIAR